jgi:hypothetical protein
MGLAEGKPGSEAPTEEQVILVPGAGRLGGTFEGKWAGTGGAWLLWKDGGATSHLQ